MMRRFRPIRYTVHAVARMRKRKVSEAEVEQTIRSGAHHRDGIKKWIAHARIAGREVQVVYVEVEDGSIEVLLVLTVIAGGWQS